jgi:hypothetical protein
MFAPAPAEPGWRAAQPLVSARQAADRLFACFAARPGYYLTIAARSLPRGSEPGEVVMEVIVGLSERAPLRAAGPRPIRDHGAYLARAIHRAAVCRARRLRRVEPLEAESVVAPEDVVRLAELDLELDWGRRELRRRLASGELALTPNQYRALCCQEGLDARRRAARARGRRLLMPLLRELAERLHDGEGARARPGLDEDAVWSLLTVIGFFDPDVARLVAAGPVGTPTGGAEASGATASQPRPRRPYRDVRTTVEVAGRQAGPTEGQP